MMIIVATNRRRFVTFPLQLPGKRGCHLLEGGPARDRAAHRRRQSPRQRSGRTQARGPVRPRRRRRC